MKKINKLIFGVSLVMSLLLIAGLFAINVGIPVNIGKNTIISAEKYQEYLKFKKLIDYKNKIDKDYYSSYSDDDLIEGAIRGMFSALPDGYSMFYTAKELKDKADREKGNFIGIGVRVRQNENKQIIIEEVFEGGPADRAKLKKGDRLLSINNILLTEQNMDKALELLKENHKKYFIFGSLSPVNLKILRNNREIEFKVNRENITLSSVYFEMIGNIGYIRLDSFIQTTESDFLTAIQAVKENHGKGLILDLRNNPGGLVNQATNISGYLLGEKVIYYTTSKNKDLKENISSKKQLFELPIVVLANSNTASASEILIGAIKDYKRGIIVGETTYGKGIIQTTFSQWNGSGYKITTSEYLTPNKNKIHHIGILPDFDVLDEHMQLEKAKELVNERK